ncbi:DegV family protein, partial [Streptococcus pyogenes]
MDLIVAELNRLIAQGLEFDQIVEAVTTYQEKSKLLFVLAKVDNLVKNGRLSKLLGTVVGLLNIRMVGEASGEGKLELLQKAR